VFKFNLAESNQMPATKLTISEVAELLNVSPKIMRHYHTMGVLEEPERGENGYRLYGASDLSKIQRIRELQGLGLSLKQIKWVLNADDADVFLRAFLTQHNADLSMEIHRLQEQQAQVRQFLSTATPQAPSTVQAHEVIRTVLHPVSNGLADVVVEVEFSVLKTLDRLPHTDEYALLWEQVAQHFVQSMGSHEHFFILWLERYLAMASMTHDDQQAQSWLKELDYIPEACLLVSAFQVPPMDNLPPQEQTRLGRLIPVLMYEHASPLQRAFIATLSQKKS
jgi:DNA-binding transcriptional MerR regulator